MSDAQLTPLQQWLIEVAAQAKQRPWYVVNVCAGCDRPRGNGHFEHCRYAAIDAALDKEPT